jgi:hypothetical protein
MSGVLPFASGNIVDDLLGCFGLEEGSVSVYLCTCFADKGVVDVIDRREEGRNTRSR